MTLSVAELRKRIEQGEGLRAINRSLISPAEQGLLRCCAVVRTFDEKLIDSVFRTQVPGADETSVPFSVLTSYDFVQRVPRSDGVYSLLPASRKQYYDSWWESSDVPRSEVPAALRELSLKLLEHYEALGNENQLDLLAQQVFVDKEKACNLFEELYMAADAAFDLARCRDIINVLTGFENVLGPELARKLNDTNRYLQSRSLWATEYYQTVSYYDRKELSSEFESFLAGKINADGEKKWILHLHAPGGMGKTMFVRWLIARRCVPLPHTIPCGRVDFDFVNRITTSQHRWQLFLKIARELEVQIPGNFFHSLIGKFTDYERILNHQQSQQSTSSTTTQLPDRKKLEDEMLYLFGNALRDAHRDGPVVLIFDTLEEVILYHPENLLEIVGQVKTLRKAFPNVLLVLSGRYDLTESGPEATKRLPQFNEDFGGVTETLRVKPFTDDEALGFLKLRGLTTDRPLEIVVERAEGNPFKLALFADILLDDPKITADTIRSYPSADLLYLIERVLARIPNKTLHWLLRYGVVPRKLSFSFVKDVMQKHLLRAISGDDPHDDPKRYQYLTQKVQATVREKEIFVKTAEELDLDQLWKDLQNYASKFAWVTMDDSDPNIASFHGDVVNPMRRWLEEEPVYKLLHQDAVAYFEKKAQDDPKDWGKWMSNAVYHKFQLEGSDAADYWRQLITNEQDPARRHALADEISGSEYVDDELKPRALLNGREIISVAVLAEAYYELARASVDMARAQKAAAGDQLWSDADSDLQTCERLQQELPVPSVHPVSVASLRSSILLTQGRVDEAIPILEEALKQNPAGYARVTLELNLANAFNLLGNYQKAAFYAESSAEGLDRFDITGVLAVAVRRTIAQLHRDLGDLEASAAQLRKALDSVWKDDQNSRFELTQELRNIYFEMGQFSRARDTLSKSNLVINNAQSLIDQLQELNDLVRFYIAVGEPRQAMIIARDIDGLIRSEFYNAATDKVRNALDVLSAQGVEQRGSLMSALSEIKAARQDFELARGLWRDLGNSKAVKNCMLKKAELFLNAGEINEARSILDETSRLSVENDSEQWFEENLLRLRIMHFSGEASGVIKTHKLLIEKRATDEQWRPTLRAKLMLHTEPLSLLEHRPKAMNQFFSDLTVTLQQVGPVSARMLLLDPLTEYPSGSDIDYPVAEELMALFPLNRNDDDFNVNAPKIAELLRVLGRKDQAVSLLKDLIRNDSGNNSFALRRVLLTLGRTAPFRAKSSDLKKFLEAFLSDYEPFPVLCGATLIELAELSLAMRSSSERLRLLDQAEELLKTNDQAAQWMARLFALRGRLTVKEDRKNALQQLERAIGLQTSLGNNLAAAKLHNLRRLVSRDDKEESRPRRGARSSGSTASAQSSIRALETEAPTATIRIEGNWTESVTINTTLPGEEVTTRRLPIEPESLLDQILAFETYENYSFSFLRAMDDNWIAACYGLGQILMDDKQGQKLRALPQKSALRLIIDALQLSSAPWEMMVMPPASDTPASVSPTLSFFYRSVGKPNLRITLDSVWVEHALLQAPSTSALYREGNNAPVEEILKRFQRDSGLPDHGRLDGVTQRMLKRRVHENEDRYRPRVLLLRPSIERQRATSRGDEVFGFSPEVGYSRENFRDVVIVEDPHVASVKDVLSTFQPDVVHICPTMEESPSIGIFLDFGSDGTGVMPQRNIKSGAARQRAETPSGDVQFITLSALAELIKGLQKPDRARPLLILDVLEPAGRTELLTQLFLRNAFAAQLYELGAFESIIATGLTPPELREEMLRTLISAVGNFQSVGETVNHLRRLADLGSYTRLAPVGDNPGPLRDPADDNYLSKVVATAGTALFTPDPEM